MTGTWRAKIHTDPKASPIAQAAFLVEDFVPERLELKLEPAVQALAPQEPGTIKLAGRYLYGPPAAGLAVEGEIAVKLAKGDLPGFAGYKFGLADEQVAPVRKPLEGLPATNAEGKADIAVRLPRAAQDQPAARSRRDPEAAGSRAGAPSSAPSRCPSTCKAPRIGIKPLFTGGQARGGRARTLRGHRARRRRQGRRGQGPQVGADAPRPALAVVQPRRLVELRARRPTRAASPPARPMQRPARRPRSRPRSTGAAIASRSAPPTARASSPAWCSAPATTPTRPPTAPRCSTSRSTSRPTRRARRRASRSPRAWPAAP